MKIKKGNSHVYKHDELDIVFNFEEMIVISLKRNPFSNLKGFKVYVDSGTSIDLEVDNEGFLTIKGMRLEFEEVQKAFEDYIANTLLEAL